MTEPRHPKYFRALPDDALWNAYQDVLDYIQTEGWEYDVTHKETELETIWAEIQRRTKP